MKQLMVRVLASLVVVTVAACGGGGAGDDAGDVDAGTADDAGPPQQFTMPLMRPPIEAATPPGLRPPATARFNLLPPTGLDPLDIKSRFFSEGPTNMFAILDELDGRISFINTLSAMDHHACVDIDPPVEYTITPFGQSVTMYAQCFEKLGPGSATDPKLIQWGVKDGVTYILLEIGAARLAAISTPNPVMPDQPLVHVWYGVGYGNAGCGAWDGCSYGVTEIVADSSTGSFAMAVAGIGVGYCGLQYRSSDGSNIYFEGSGDAGTTCMHTDTLCSDGADITVGGTCATEDMTFTLNPLGRLATTGDTRTWGASDYPAVPNITLDGTTSDDLYFLSTDPIEGVVDFAMPMMPMP